MSQQTDRRPPFPPRVDAGMRYKRSMALGRRGTEVSDESAWVFNRMADVYHARPAYPPALIEAIVAVGREVGPRVLDLGAGIGHVALPLLARGFEVTAVEPARAMLERLQHSAQELDFPLRALHAAAEAIPVESSSFDLVIIADALHFLDAEQTGLEVARVLSPRGALVIVKSELGTTSFMQSLVALMEESAPRRPRATRPAEAQVSALAGVVLSEEEVFTDETPMGHDELENILRSISFIGPAMNAERFETFRTRVRALSDHPSWGRRFTLRHGRRPLRRLVSTP